MKKQWILLMTLLFTGISLSEINAQSLIIKMNDGIENTVAMNTLQKLNFSESDLVVVFKSGSNDFYNLSNIRKLYFDASTMIGENYLLNKQLLQVFPNPACNSITVHGIPEDAGFISIYKMDGQLALTETVSSNTLTINIDQLHNGLYLLFASGRTSKFIKQ